MILFIAPIGSPWLPVAKYKILFFETFFDQITRSLLNKETVERRSLGTFFVKDYLNLSAAFLAGLGFWAGIPWALKMPLGHLVDLIWNRKNYMVYFGASLIALSLLIMYGLIIHTEDMSEVFSVETWFVISVILAPVGYVIQDVVADAMTVEAVPLTDEWK